MDSRDESDSSCAARSRISLREAPFCSVQTLGTDDQSSSLTRQKRGLIASTDSSQYSNSSITSTINFRQTVKSRLTMEVSVHLTRSTVSNVCNGLLLASITLWDVSLRDLDRTSGGINASTTNLWRALVSRTVRNITINRGLWPWFA